MNGFIVPDAGGVGLFCHISRIADGVDALREGQRVEFNERPSRKKPDSYEAVDVRVI
jgi:cold shock CspA family protein